MMLGEARGGIKREHCPRCDQVVDMMMDHGPEGKGWVCPNCDMEDDR